MTSTAADVTELYRRASDAFIALVDAVTDDQWEQPTPCAEWDVRALVNHVVGQDLWTPMLLSGRTSADIGQRYDGDVLGKDPRRSAAIAAAAAVAAVTAPGSRTRTVHLAVGAAPGEVYIWQIFADHLIHAWDLATAIGADTGLDPELVAACERWFAPHEEAWRAAGAIGPHVPGSADDDAQRRLLARFGRDAG